MRSVEDAGGGERGGGVVPARVRVLEAQGRAVAHEDPSPPLSESSRLGARRESHVVVTTYAKRDLVLMTTRSLSRVDFVSHVVVTTYAKRDLVS